MKRFLILFLLFAVRAFSQAVPGTYPYPTLLPTSGTITGGVLVTGPLRTSNYADNRAVVWDDFVGGGFRSVQSLVERDSIIAGRRKEGMWVFVSASSGDAGAGHIYALAADLVTWYDLGAAITGSLANADTSIYKDDGILEENRIISGTNSYNITFQGIPNYTITAGNLHQVTSPSIYLDGTTSIEFNRSVSPLIFRRTPTAINNTEYITVKDPATGEFKTSTTTIASLQAGVSASGNIYTTNGTLAGNRTLAGGGFGLTITNVNGLSTYSTTNINSAATYQGLFSLGTLDATSVGNMALTVASGNLTINGTSTPYKFATSPSTAASGDYIMFRNSAGEVRYDATVTKASLAGSTTLYSGNSSLASDRTLAGAGYNLNFTNLNNNYVTGTNLLYVGSTLGAFGGASAIFSGTTALSLQTPSIGTGATTTQPGQFLQLQNTTGGLEYAPIYYTSTTSGQTGSTYTFSNAQMAPDFVQTYDHPVGTVAYLTFNATSVGADAIKLGPSTTTLGIVHHDGSVIAAGELLADVPYTFVKVGTGGSAKWLLQGHTSATTYTPLLNRVATVATVADLVALDPIRFQAASTKGYYSAADGGAGTYYWVSNQTSTNKGAKIASSSSGSWVLLADEFNVKQWGAKGDGSTDDSVAINAAITYAGTQGINRSVYIPRGEFRIGAPIYIRGSNIKLRVHGHVKNINGTNTAVLIAGAIYDTGTAARITNGIAYYDTSNVSIDGEGIGILDQNGPNATDWDYANPDAGKWHTLIAQTIKGLQIKNITVTNSIIWSIAVELCKEAEVTGNRVYNGRHSGRQVSGVYVKGTQDGIHFHDCMDSVMTDNYVESQDDTLAVIAYRSHSKNIVVANNVGRVLTRYYLADGVTPDTNTIAGRFFLSAGIFGQTADVSLTNVVFSANSCTGGQGMFFIFDEDGDVAHAGTTQGIKLIGNSFSGLVDELSGTNTTLEAWTILGAKDVDIVNNSFVNIARVGRAVEYLSPTPGYIRFAGNYFENWQVAPDSQTLHANQPESILWFAAGTDIVIENNTFVNNRINPIYIGNNGGESTTNQFNSVTIRGNVFKNNMQRWSSTPTAVSSVATVYGANHVVFSDNVLDSNKGRGATVRSYKTLQANNNKVTAHSSGYTDYGETFYLSAAANDSAITTTLQNNSVDTIDGYFAYFQNPGFATVQNNIIKNSNVSYGSDQAMFMYLSGTALSDLPYANFGGVFSGNQIFDTTAKIPMYVGGTISTAAYTGRKLAYLDTQGAGGEVSVAANGAGIIDFSQGYVVVTGNYTLKTYQQYAKVTAAATVTLPDATLCYGKEFTIKRLTSGAVTLATTSSQTFNGGAITQIVGDTLTVKSDGANWFSRVETIYTPLQLPDADFTYTVGSSANYYTESSITANRVVTLSTTGAYAGARVVFDRSAWTSVYTLTVSSILMYGGDHIEFVFYNGSWFPEVIRKYARNDVTIVSSDSSTTFYPATSVKQLLYTGVITTDRTITLDTAGAQEGSVVRVTRTATSTGAFNLTVGTKALTVGTWADFVYDTGTAAWHLAAAGSL